MVESPRTNKVIALELELVLPCPNSASVSIVIIPENRPAKVFPKFDSGDLSNTSPLTVDTAPVNARRETIKYPKSI